MKPRIASRRDRERMTRVMAESFVLPAIGDAGRRAGLRGDALLSACMSEVETIKELRHITGGLR